MMKASLLLILVAGALCGCSHEDPVTPPKMLNPSGQATNQPGVSPQVGEKYQQMGANANASMDEGARQMRAAMERTGGK